MALNVKQMKASSSKARVAQAEIPKGNYMARVAQVIDLGVQALETWDATMNKYVVDTNKRPTQKVMVTYEFVTEFVKDAEGNPDESKPRWLSEEFPLYPLTSDLAKSTKRYKAIDPSEMHEGDFTALVGMPCFVVVDHKKSGKAKVKDVTAAIAGIPVPELKNEPKVFILDEPDMEVFGSLPEWIQDKIKGGVGFASTPLAEQLGGAPAPQPTPEPEAPAPQAEPEMEEPEDGCEW